MTEQPTTPDPTDPTQPTPDQPEQPEPQPPEVPDPEPVQEVPDAWDEQRAAQEGVPGAVSEPAHDPAATDPNAPQEAQEGSQVAPEGGGA